MKFDEILNFIFFRFYSKGHNHLNTFRELAHSSVEDYEVRLLGRMNDLLNYSYQKIPYYREILGALPLLKNDRIEIEHIDQLKLIPILTKDIIRREGDRLYHPAYKSMKTKWNTSGGSTGAPIRILQDLEFKQSGAGLFAFVREMRGVSPHAFTVILWGAVRDLYGAKNNIKGKIVDLVNNSKVFNAAKLTPKAIEYFIEYCNKKQPKFMIAYVQSIHAVALYAKKNNIKVNPIPVIHTGAGQLFDFMRSDIEEVFSCEVFDHYGGREMGALATECKAHNGLHILGDRSHIEIVDQDYKDVPKGEVGEILVTRFANRVMPLIRYQVGDTSIWSEDVACKCGVVYPRLARITGRTSNNFKLKDGGFVSGEYLTLSYNHIAGIVKFQIRQIDFQKIIIYLVIDNNYINKNETIIRTKMTKLFGDDLDLTFEYVDYEKYSLTYR